MITVFISQLIKPRTRRLRGLAQGDVESLELLLFCPPHPCYLHIIWVPICKYTQVLKGKWGRPCGRVVEFAAQGFPGSDPGRRHGTAHPVMLRRHPTCHHWKDPQLCSEGFGGEKGEIKLKSLRKKQKTHTRKETQRSVMCQKPSKGSVATKSKET